MQGQTASVVAFAHLTYQNLVTLIFSPHFATLSEVSPILGLCGVTHTIFKKGKYSGRVKKHHYSQIPVN